MKRSELNSHLYAAPHKRCARQERNRHESNSLDVASLWVAMFQRSGVNSDQFRQNHAWQSLAAANAPQDHPRNAGFFERLGLRTLPKCSRLVRAYCDGRKSPKEAIKAREFSAKAHMIAFIRTEPLL